jgi:hypothetical protein
MRVDRRRDDGGASGVAATDLRFGPGIVFSSDSLYPSSADKFREAS